MATSEAEYLKLMWDLNLCPRCHAAIAEGMGVGSGSKAKGLFCSLDCFAKYNAHGVHPESRTDQAENASLQ
jgi:hypothetical protein